MHDVKTLSDKEIISFIKARNEQVFGDVFKLYRSSLHRYATLFIEDHQAIEDLVQDLFVKLWFNADEISITSSLKSYLFRMLHNSALNYIRHQKVVDSYFKEQAYTGEASLKIQPSEPLLKEHLHKAIDTLPALTKDIFLLSRVEGYKHEEIAQQLAISTKTVEAHLTKASKKLKEELKHYAPALMPLLFFLMRG